MPAKPKDGYAAFTRGLGPLLDRLFAEIIRDNREKIKVKNEKVAAANVRRIFDAALQLSRKKGFHAMSLRDLSESSGLSMGALYSYFESKEELRGIVLHYCPQVAARVVRAETDGLESAPDRLAAAVRAHLYLSEALRDWFYFCYMEAKNLSGEEKNDAMAGEGLTESIYLEVIEAGVDSGQFEVDDPRLAAAAVKSLLQDWYLKRWKYKRAKVSVDDYAEFVINFIGRAVTAAPGS